MIILKIAVFLHIGFIFAHLLNILRGKKGTWNTKRFLIENKMKLIATELCFAILLGVRFFASDPMLNQINYFLSFAQLPNLQDGALAIGFAIGGLFILGMNSDFYEGE